jgi:hypothetical protein
MGAGGSVLGAWSWPLTNAEVKNAWSYTATPSYVFMAQCFIMHTKKITVLIQILQDDCEFIYAYVTASVLGFCL